MAGKTGAGYTPGSGAEIASWLDNEADLHQLTVMEFLPSSSGTADPTVVSPQNPLPVTLATNSANLAQETGGNLASIASSNTTIATDIAVCETSLGTIATAQGAGGTGITEPAGGSGLLGWLSGIYKALIGGVFGIYNTSPPTMSNGVAGPIQLDVNGNVKVAVITGGGTGGTSLTDNATFTRGTTAETPIGAAVETSAPSLTAGKAGALSMDTSGNLRVSLQAGGAAAGVVGTPSTDIVSVTLQPTTAPGSTVSRLHAAGSTNATSLKASAGVLLTYSAINNATAARFLKFYNKASAPTVGTDTPLFTIPLAPDQGGANLDMPSGGIPFSTGIAYAMTLNEGDSDTNAVTAGDIDGFLLWK